MAPIPVPAPPLTPPRYSLLNTATTLGADAWPSGWEDQITWEPECPDPDALPVRDGCEGAGVGGAVNTSAGYPVVSAVRLSATDTCSLMGSNRRDWQGRARRLLAATESAQLARHLWTGAATDSVSGDETPFLDDGDADEINAGGDLLDQVALLEAEAAGTVAGRPWLHMPIRTFTTFLAAANGAVQIQGGVATTAYGSVIVTDAGYPTDSDRIYATGPVYVRLGDVDVYGDDASGVQRDVNSRTVTAHRYAAYQIEACRRLYTTWDPPGD